MADERKQIGWQLVPIYEAPKGSIVTQAFIICAGCGALVSGTGGPRSNAYCMKCVTPDTEPTADRKACDEAWGRLQQLLLIAFGAIPKHPAIDDLAVLLFERKRLLMTAVPPSLFDALRDWTGAEPSQSVLSIEVEKWKEHSNG